MRVEGRLEHQRPMRVQLAVYYACVEAIQNATKHTGAQNGVVVLISESTGTTVDFRVSDDGPGFDVVSARGGTGLFNIRERVRSAGGTVEISSSMGRDPASHRRQRAGRAGSRATRRHSCRGRAIADKLVVVLIVLFASAAAVAAVTIGRRRWLAPMHG